jgi:dienelactone hydrolase
MTKTMVKNLAIRQANLPKSAKNILVAVREQDVEKWREKWTRFLFGGKPPKKRLRKAPQENPHTFHGAIERFRLTYEVEPGLTTEAYVLRPKTRRRNLPGIVLFHESGPDTIAASGSIDSDLEMSIAAHLALRGYLVLCPKCFIYGKGKFPSREPRDIHRAEVKKMQRRHPQWTGLGRMVWDGIRAVDVLVDHYHVKKVGAVGHSLGAKEVLFLMAFDERVDAGIASDGGIGLNFSNWQKVWYLGPTIQKKGFQLENHQVLAMIAPRAFLLVGGAHDNERARPYIAAVTPLWKSQGLLKNIRHFVHRAGHRWPPEAQNIGYRFLDRHLKAHGDQ